MHALFAILLAGVAAAASVQAEAPTSRTESAQAGAGLSKTDFSYFASWGLKLKSLSLEFADKDLPDGRAITIGKLIYVLEFDKDVVLYDLDALQRQLSPQTLKLRHLFFDKDNVAINANRIYEHKLQGDVSGVKGEGFRIIVDFVVDPQASVLQAKKLVVRAG
ncbi:MAG: hypothetical protein HYR84_12545 [Planctomycetes bacterium]|nr:hypothetical protein [Planctomycetota bacterium]